VKPLVTSVDAADCLKSLAIVPSLSPETGCDRPGGSRVGFFFTWSVWARRLAVNLRYRNNKMG
jgi:hypothetical protein